MKIIFRICFLFLLAKFFSQTTKTFTLEKSVYGLRISDNASVTVRENQQPHSTVSGTFYDYAERNGILEFGGNSTVTLSCSSDLINIIHCANKSKITIHFLTNYDSLSVTTEDNSHARIYGNFNKFSVNTNDYTNLMFSGHAHLTQIQSSDFSLVNISRSNRAYYKLSDFATLKLCAIDEVNGTSEDFAKITLSGNPLIMNVETNEFSRIYRNKSGCKSVLNPMLNSSLDGQEMSHWEDYEDDNEKSEQKKSNKKRYSWQGISAGVNAVVNENNSFSFDKKYDFFEPNYSSSFNFQLNPFQQNFYLYERSIVFLTGFGIEWRIFGLRKKSYIDPDTSFFHGYIDTTSGFTLKKNNLRNFNIQIPFLFDFRFGKKNRFFVHDRGCWNMDVVKQSKA